MDIRKWLEELKKEVFLTQKHWTPIIKDAFFSSISGWVTALGIGFVATLLALFVTFKQDGKVILSNFFPPNFGWGLLIVFFFIFIYQLIIGVAKKFESYKSQIDKYSWNDVLRFVNSNDPDAPYIVSLVVTNNKPYDIENFYLEVTHILKGRFPDFESPLPLNLGWSNDDNGIVWSETTLLKSGLGLFAFVTWLESNKKPRLHTGKMDENGGKISEYIELERDIEYRITIDWHGKIDGHSLDSFTNSYLLKVAGDKILVKEVKK